MLFREGTGNAAFVVDLLLNGRDFLNFVVENDCKLIVDVRPSERGKTASTFTGQKEADGRTLVLIASWLGIAKIAACNSGGPADQIVGVCWSARVGATNADVASFEQDRIRRKNPAMRLQGFLLAGVRPTQRLPDLQHRRGLHDLFHASGIIDTGKLDENLILAQAMFFDDGLADAELVNTVANRFDGLRDCTILQVGKRGRLHRKYP